MQERTCKCGSTFVVPYPSSGKLNCSSKCRGVKSKRRADAGQRKSEWVTLTCYCGTDFQVPPWESRGGNRKYCSAKCREKYRVPGSGRPRRQDRERFLNVHGYVLVYVPPAERAPGAWAKRSHQPEHRVVMAKHLGRHLLPGENVHHLNGVKTDNRLENLELWTTPPMKGVRAADLLKWAREVVARYEPIEDRL